MATATITSNTATLRGNKDIQIVMRAEYVTTESYSMTISDIGGYEFAADVQEDTDDISEFLFNIPSFEFSFWSDLNGDDDFGNILSGLTFQDLVEIEVTYDGITDIFACQKTDFEYNRLERKVNCVANSPFKYGDKISAYDDSARVFDATFSGVNYDCITVRDLIEAYLQTLTISQTTIVNSMFQKVKNPDQGGNGLSVGDGVNIYVKHIGFGEGILRPEGENGEFVMNTFAKIKAAVLGMGILEGAIVGSMFNEAFYIRRDYNETSDTDYFTEIGASDLEVFDLEFSTGAVDTITIAGGSTENEQEYSAYGETTEDIGSGNQVINVTSGYSRDALLGSNPSGGFTLTINGSDMEVTGATLTSNSVETYKSVLGVSDNIKFSGTILGTEKLKPYQFIRLNTYISPFVTTDNRDIRLSYVKYNLKEDKIEFEAYSI